MSDTARMLAVEAVALSELATRVQARLDQVKAELRTHIGVSDRTTARLQNGQKIGSVTYAERKPTVSVVSESLFTAWVAENYPGDIVTAVRPAFARRVLEISKEAGLPCGPMGETDVPGLLMVGGSSYLTVRPDHAAIADIEPATWLSLLRANADLSLEAES